MGERYKFPVRENDFLCWVRCRPPFPCLLMKRAAVECFVQISLFQFIKKKHAMQINRKVRRPDPDPSPVDYCWALSLILLINHLKKSQKDKEIRGNVCRVWLNIWNNVTIDNANKIFFYLTYLFPTAFQQHLFLGGFLPFPRVTVSVWLLACSFCSFLVASTWRVMALNISSTFLLSLALVSNSWIPIWLAKRWASSVRTTFRSGISSLFPTITEKYNWLKIKLCFTWGVNT